MRTRETYLPAALLLIAMMLFGCEATPAPSEPAEPALSMSTNALLVPPDEVVAMLDQAIQDEYYLQALYTKVMADLGELKPFNRILDAEGRHVAALARQYEKYRLTVPTSEWTSDELPDFETQLAACTEAASAETANAAMYEGFLLSTDLPERIQSVFESLKAASLDSHLAAFTRCM